MNAPAFADIAVGDVLPSVEMPPLTRQALAIYCGASGDHNPVHVDIDFAREAGLGDVIAHGMLIMAYTGRVLTQWVPQSAIVSFDTRFKAMTRIGDRITARGTVTRKYVEDGRQLVVVSVTAADDSGDEKTAGAAVIALD